MSTYAPGTGPVTTKHPQHGDIDEVAVLRCAAGTLHHSRLSWPEVEQAVLQLEPWLNDIQISHRIGGGDTTLTAMRHRQGWTRQQQPRQQQPLLTDADVRRIRAALRGRRRAAS